MNDVERRLISPDPACRSAEVGSFLAQLDDLTRRLTRDTRTLTPEMLRWQSAPGMNTSGMLLAHLAIVEVHWAHLGLEHRPAPAAFRDILGIDEYDDGIPLEPAAPAPAGLAGKPLSFFDDLLARGRAHLRHVARSLTDEALAEELTVRRANGTELALNRRWTLYHLLEHYAGHYGQILLIRHQYRIAHPGG